MCTYCICVLTVFVYLLYLCTYCICLLNATFFATHVCHVGALNIKTKVTISALVVVVIVALCSCELVTLNTQ